MFNITNVTFIDCGTGISAPKDANVSINGASFENCGKAIDLRDPPSLLSQIGLKEDTPPRLVLALLQGMKAAGQGTPIAIEKKAERIGLFAWLAAGSSVATLVSAFHEIFAKGWVDSAIALFSGLAG